MTEHAVMVEQRFPQTRHHFWMDQMSQLSPGPGWWLASDGKWYSPQTVPSPSPVPPMPPLGLPPISAPGFTSNGSFQPGQAAMPSYSGAAQGAAAYPYAPGPQFAVPRTSPMAIWALVLVILLGAIGALVGIPLAFVARSKIRKSGGALQGSGLALAALIVGFGWVALFAFAIAIPTFLGVTHSGPAVENLNYSVKGQIIGTAPNDFDVAGVSNVSCQRPSSWTTGSTFSCIVYGSARTVIGRYYGTVEPNTSDGIYQWNGRYFPSS
jgi:Domain of unknown function (DUF4190)